MATIERIRDFSVLLAAGVVVVALVWIACAVGTRFLGEADRRPVDHPSVEIYGQPFEPTPAQKERMAAREAQAREAREREIVPFIVD